MASKRELKKAIVTIAASLFDEALLLRSFSSDEQIEALEHLMDDIMVWTDDSIRRASHPDGAHNPKLVRAYYRGLNQDIQTKVSAFEDRLTAFVEAL